MLEPILFPKVTNFRKEFLSIQLLLSSTVRSILNCIFFIIHVLTWGSAQIFVDVLLHGTNFNDGYGPFNFQHSIYPQMHFTDSKGSQSGESQTAIAGTVRLASDGLVSISNGIALDKY